MSLDSTLTTSVTGPTAGSPRSLSWSARLAAWLVRVCTLLRETHEARIPF
jgi:hypothetical protein